MMSPPMSLLVLIAVAFLWTARAAVADDGDQLTDGIGETSLIARYPLDGNADDRSRNGLTATPAGAAFTQDRRFGRVLSLAGEPSSGLKLPGRALAKADSISVVGWVRLRTGAADQTFVDFGTPGGRSLVVTLTGTDTAAGPGVGFTTANERLLETFAAEPVRRARWTHLAVTVDAAGRTATVYVDGRRVGRTKPSDVGLEDVLDAGKPEANVLLIGPRLDALLRDVRLYSVALTETQVATIHANGRSRGDGRATTRSAPPTSRPAVVDFGGPRLVALPNVAVTTAVGRLPTLPVWVAGGYENGASGPKVRVIWPAPRDAAAVREAGRYEVVGRVPGTTLTATAVVTVGPMTQTPPPAQALASFGLGEVVLDNDSAGRATPYTKNRDKFLRGLLLTNPDDFLYVFRDAFGQPQPPGVRPLGGWDGPTTRLRGHATGHYLSALAQAYAGSSDAPATREKLLAKMDYTIDTLDALARKSGVARSPGGDANADPTKVPVGPGRSGFDSDLRQSHIRTDHWNWGRSFISAYPPDQFIMLENGATYGTRNDQVWAPYYTLHKIIAGLLDCYEVGGNQKALDVARGMGLWCDARLRVLPVETRTKMWNRYIAGEYGGMNEAMARLGRLTGDRRFIETARLFDNPDFFYGGPQRSAGLLANVDAVRGKHANQHIPQVLGALELYANTNDPAYFHIAANFWDMVHSGYTYSIGGVAGASTPNNAECFPAEPDTLGENGFAAGGQNETCATYNLLKLGRALFMYRPDDPRYMDYYERALVNDILASVAEGDAGNTYHIPLNPGARKQFGNDDMRGFTCCNGTALEINTKLQDTIYLKHDDDRQAQGDPALFVNLFVPSTLKWAKRKAVVRQETQFPYADVTRLTLTGLNGVDLRVRVPAWATHGHFVKINGHDQPVNATPGSHVNLGREWKDGDTVELRMPFGFSLDRVADRPKLASILYGPVVLAAEESGPLPDWRKVTLDPTDPGRSITGDPATLRFRLGGLTLKPFFESYGRYSVYFDVDAG